MRNGNIFTMKPINDETTSELFSQLGGLLGVSRGSDGKYHLADLCTAGSIAIGARFKPFRNSSDNFGYDPNNPSVGNAERAKQSQLANFGINIPTTGFGDVKTMADAVYNGTYKWEYLKPQGRANGSPFRIRDFDGYKHDAISPIRAEVASFQQGIPYESSTGQINPYFRITRAGDPYQLSIEELRFETADWAYTFKDMYLGMCARRTSDGAVYYAIMPQTYSEYLASTQHDEVSVGISIPAPTSRTQSYYCFPFFATGQTIGNNTMYPVPLSSQTISVYRLSQQIIRAVGEAFLFRDTIKPLYYRGYIYNGRYTDATFTYRLLGLKSNDKNDIAYELASGSISVPARSTAYIPSEQGGQYTDTLYINQINYMYLELRQGEYNPVTEISISPVIREAETFDPPWQV